MQDEGLTDDVTPVTDTSDGRSRLFVLLLVVVRVMCVCLNLKQHVFTAPEKRKL